MQPTTPPAPGRAPRRWARRTLLFGVLAASLSGCTYNFENNPGITTQARHIHNLFVGFDIAALAVGALIWALIAWCVIFFRRKGPDHWPKQTRYNIVWEFFYTLTPLLAVGVLFGYTVVTENAVDKVTPNPDHVINITAFQWGWRFEYPLANGQIAQVVTSPDNFGTFELPVDQTTRVYLRSADVVHEFLVSPLNFQRYAQPGVTNVFDLTPTTTGYWVGRCNFICGLHHDLMVFHLRVVQPGQFQNWLTQQHALTTKAAA